MGAIWNFLAGKSTDWDALDRKRAEQESQRPKKARYKAYCKICGAYHVGTAYSPAYAIQRLQNENGKCKAGNHIPAIQEVWE